MHTTTPTYELMDELIGRHGLSEEFIWAVVGSCPQVMYCAATGYVEYLGETLERLHRVRNACLALFKDKSIKVTTRDFIEEQVLVMDTEHGSEYKRAGEFIADGVISIKDALIYARETTPADIIDSQELLPFLGKPSPPSKYHPVLRAVFNQDSAT